MTVTEPEDGIVVEFSTVTARGTCTDAHLESFTVNGEETPRDGSGAFEKAVFLSGGAGGTTIDAVAEDEYRNVTTVTRTVEVAPLEVQIASPQDGQVLDAASVTVSGTVRGPRDAEVFVNGQRAARDGETFTLASLPLAECPNTLTAHAQTPGDSAQHTITVVRDTTNPAVTIEYPSEGDVFNATSITVTGTVEEANLVSVSVNGVQAELYSGFFVAESVPLNAEGSNDIIVTATDAVNRTGQAQVSVTRDTMAPSVEITSPTGGSKVHSAVATVNGTASADTAYLLVNGVRTEPQASSWSAQVYLDIEGQNTITATAYDGAGNEGVDSVTVTRNLPPMISIEEVAFSPLSTEEQLKVRITGAVDDAQASIAAINDSVDPAVVAGGVNTSGVFVVAELDVYPGDNYIAVKATDSDGQTTIEHVLVQVSADAEAYKTPPGWTEGAVVPQITVSLPEDAGEGSSSTCVSAGFMTFAMLAAAGPENGASLAVENPSSASGYLGQDFKLTVTVACNSEWSAYCVISGDLQSTPLKVEGYNGTDVEQPNSPDGTVYKKAASDYWFVVTGKKHGTYTYDATMWFEKVDQNGQITRWSQGTKQPASIKVMEVVQATASEADRCFEPTGESEIFYGTKSAASGQTLDITIGKAPNETAYCKIHEVRITPAWSAGDPPLTAARETGEWTIGSLNTNEFSASCGKGSLSAIVLWGDTSHFRADQAGTKLVAEEADGKPNLTGQQEESAVRVNLRAIQVTLWFGFRRDELEQSWTIANRSEAPSPAPYYVRLWAKATPEVDSLRLSSMILEAHPDTPDKGKIEGPPEQFLSLSVSPGIYVGPTYSAKVERCTNRRADSSDRGPDDIVLRNQQVFLALQEGGKVLDVKIVNVKSVFKYLVYKEKRFQAAVNYVEAKYSEVIGKARAEYSDTKVPEGVEGWTVGMFNVYTYLPFSTLNEGENKMASTIGHEQVHQKQRWDLRFKANGGGARGKYYEALCEIPAWQWEVDNADGTCIPQRVYDDAVLKVKGLERQMKAAKEALDEETRAGMHGLYP